MLSALQYTAPEARRPRPLPTSERKSTEGGRPLPIDNQPPPYGWRLQLQKQPDGTEDYVEIPLTEEDFLDPQEGDHRMQKIKHLRCTIEIFNRLDNYYAQNPTTGVFSDLKMEWGIPGLKEPAPDIAVVPALREKEPDLGTFKVLEQGTRPALVIEVMSPSYQGDDTVKVQLYQQAGVNEYLIVNPYHGDHRNHYHLTLYRLVGQKYQQVPPDSQGRFLSDTTGVFFHVSADHRQVLLTVAATGEKLLTATEEKQARLQEVRARVAAEAQARLEAKARLKEARARAAAKAQAQLEAQARTAAEAQAQLEAQARVAAETQAQLEAQARVAAETQAQLETQARFQEQQARQAAEAKLQALEARVRELEANPKKHRRR